MRSLGEKKPLQTFSGNINWHGHWRNQDSGSLKAENLSTIYPESPAHHSLSQQLNYRANVGVPQQKQLERYGVWVAYTINGWPVIKDEILLCAGKRLPLERSLLADQNHLHTNSMFVICRS